MVLGCGLSPSFCRVAGGVHVADHDSKGEHGHLVVCFGQGVEEGFRPSQKVTRVLMTFSSHLSPTTSQTLSLPGMLECWTRWTWMPVLAYKGVPLCQ